MTDVPGEGLENDPLVGTTIGNYQVVSLLGEGGMGRVYKAEHPAIGRVVAIKVVGDQFARQPDMVARFRAEALAVNMIRHPNIVDIFDFGVLPNGPPYFVMEFLEGEDLGKRLARVGRLSPDSAAPLLCQSLDALAAAHAENITHRDLKPDNIYLARRRDGSENVKLLDFGIAKLRTPAGAGVTTEGTLLGTPLYMSPEQALGRASEIGPASDIYSMGVILYQVFTGRTPFEGPHFGALIVAHIQQPPPPPRDHAPDLDPALEAVILKCLEKRRPDRFASVADLAAALGAAIPAVAAYRRPLVGPPGTPDAAVSGRRPVGVVASTVHATPLVGALPMTTPAGGALPVATPPVAAPPVAALPLTVTVPPVAALPFAGAALQRVALPVTMPPGAGLPDPASLAEKKKRRNRLVPLAVGVLVLAGAATTAAYLLRGPTPVTAHQLELPAMPAPVVEGREVP